MISVGSRNGRKGVELRFRGEEMEETELEEGEACYRNEDDNSAIDPDVTLSYIGEKLQDVLGHFRKDFEGGVSAENLGAKFGGYGSFLPTYQRSPSWCHPRTSPEVCNRATRSPNNMHLEGGHQASLGSASLPVRPGMNSSNTVAVHRPPSGNHRSNQDVSAPPTHVEGLATNEVQRFSSFPDQNTLKFRIKVGTENFSSHRNAEIYSGLGLDVSPSSSLGDSPGESEGLYHGPPENPHESPSSILQIMTSVPFSRSQLISPLPDQIMQLIKKEQGSGRSKSKTVNKASQGLSQMVVTNGSDPKMSNGKVSSQKKPKSVEKSFASVERSNNKIKEISNGALLPKKEFDVDTLECEELVSSTLKLPLLLNSYPDAAESVKDPVKSVTTKAAAKSSVIDASSSDVAEKKPLEPVALIENGTADKFHRKFDASGTVSESRKQNGVDEYSVFRKKEVNHKEEKTELSIKPESFISDEKNSASMNVTDTSKQKVVHKVTSYNEDALKLAPGERHLSSEGKRKSKGSQSLVAPGVEILGDGPLINSSVVSKSKKASNSNSLTSKSDAEGLKKPDLVAADRYREFFGELGLEEEAVETASQEMPYLRRGKDCEFVEKKTTSDASGALKERPMGKATEEKSASRDHPRLASNMPHLAGKAPHPDAAPTMAAPLVQEYWVCCDKCHKWRLLPLGTDPKILPEKWLCSMLDWLPGMNHCSISEEETTNALRALYHTQASAAQNQHPVPGGTVLGVASGDARRSSEGSQNSGLQPTAFGGKKKFGSKDVMSATNLDSSVQVSDLKKSFQDSSKGRNLNGVDLSSSVDEFTHQHEGDAMRSKMKYKRENELDATRASKKMKTEDKRLKDENCTSDQAGTSSKAVRSSNSSFSNSASGKDPHSHSSHSRDSKGDLKKKFVSSEKAEAQISVTSDDGSLHMARCSNDSMRKRKGNDHVTDLPLPSEGHQSQGSRGFLEESCEYDQRKEKKARVSKSEGKDAGRSKDTIVPGKKAARATKDQQMGQDLGSTPSRRSIDATDSLRRDLVSVQPAVAATSSSSKVSGSHRSKASRGEMKGSPVESVSSSPLRISGADKFSQARRNIESKDDLQDAGFFATASPRRSMNGVDTDGSDQSGKMKDDCHNVMHNGSLESSVIDFQGGDVGHISNGRGKVDCTSFPHFAAQGVPDCITTNPLDQDNKIARQTQTSEPSQDERKRNDNQYTSNGSQSKKSANGSSSRYKEKTRGPRAGSDSGKIKDADSFDGSMYEEKMKAGKNKFVEKSGSSSERIEKSYVSKKDSAGKGNREISKEESYHIHYNGPVAKPDVVSGQGAMQNVEPQFDNERTSRKLLSDKTGVEDSGRVKSHSLQLTRFQPSGELKKENAEHDEVSKVSKLSKKAEKQKGNQPVNTRNLTPSTHPSPARKDSSSQATNAVKEATDLKHLADRLKNSGSTESTGLYFQAALKFLHGASLMESSGSENAKQNEMIQSMQIYSSTAKLCEFCAHEYEKSKDMAAAALAYKCVEVAYMRVIYSSYTNASKDRNELQAALQIIPTGESPSSSASDIDNLNNPVIADKALIQKGVASPQVAANHVLTARNRSSCMRLINFAQEVNFAMEASRKSRARFGEAQRREGISSVKKALDFNFQNMDGLLRLVRVAMEAINR